MEEKEYRPENLSLRDIHVGDWVQIWNRQKKAYSRPMMVSNIDITGTIGLVEDPDDCLKDILYTQADIKDINAMPITPERLRGFGFEIGDETKVDYSVRYEGKHLITVRKGFGFGVKFNYCFDRTYMHEILWGIEKVYGIRAKWKGLGPEGEDKMYNVF